MKNLTVQAALDWLDDLAPFATAEDFDNVGLLLGDPSTPVKKILFALDATPQVAAEALSFGAELVVTHHPLIFHPLRRIDYTSPQGQALTQLVEGRVNLIAAHTNWDQACGGVSDALAQALGLQNICKLNSYLRLGQLPQALSQADFSSLVIRQLHVAPTLYGQAKDLIQSVAVAGGAYGEAAGEAALHGAQAYVTGEIRHHELLDACQRGLLICQAGHYATEAPGIQALYHRFLKDAAAAHWLVQADLSHTAPYKGATL